MEKEMDRHTASLQRRRQTLKRWVQEDVHAAVEDFYKRHRRYPAATEFKAENKLAF